MLSFMPTVTAFVLAAFAGYVGAWYFDAIEGNFALLLFMASLVTGLYWLAERFYFLPQRRQAAQAVEADDARRRASLAAQGITKVDEVDLAVAKQKALQQPWWLDWTAGLFPVIVSVFFLRSFVVEPFKIPSGSMLPTLEVGDLILVNKFTYGLRLPVVNYKISEGSPVQRGDVIVFRYPPKPSLDYIKRVVGLPGDEVAYLNKKLTINGQPLALEPMPEYFSTASMLYFPQAREQLGQAAHRIITHPLRPAFVEGVSEFAFRQNCRYSVEGVVCKVPPGHYFAMGDNRDDSLDSRYWGFVPDQNLVGKAFFVWMNFGNLKRIGSFP